MNMYLNLEYTMQHQKTWFRKHEFRENTLQLLIHSMTKAGSLSEGPMLQHESQNHCSSWRKALLKHGIIAEELPDTAALQPEAQLPSAFSSTRINSIVCFCKMLTSAVAVFNAYASCLSWSFLKTYKNMSYFRDIVYHCCGKQYIL